ncbi:site-specific integrase [Ciceribacter azotifigens]|uniref:site-specific integrase n=1 Tax=Ciceribacter azotifigens TaxID=2069303 RepID=UPI003A87AD95
MATIEKRKQTANGDTYYRVRVRIQGLPEKQKTFTRLTDAKLWAQQTEAAIRRGEVTNVVTKAKGKTLADVITRYREEVLPHKAESSQRAAESYLKHWDAALGQYALSYLTPDLISAEVAKLATAGDTRRKLKEGEAPPKPKSRKTQKLYRDMLAVLLKNAKAWGWTTQNLMEGVNPITNIRNERTRFLSDEERTALLDACKASDNDQLFTVVVFALSTGARKGEILGLTLADVDLKRSSAIFRDTKNGDTRAAPLARHLRELLTEQVAKAEALYDELPDPPKTRWLFPRADGLQPIDIRTAWENARDKAELEDFRFHDLRHSTASYLAMKGASLVEIAEVLGHRTLQMVRRYAHLSESHVKGLVESLGEDIFQQPE